MFPKKDLQYFQEKGIALESIQKQLESFRKGIDYVHIIAPVNRGNGLYSPDQKKVEYYNKLFDEKITDFRFGRFIPASGAASRMFKDLFEFMAELESSNKELYLLLKENPNLEEFLKQLDSYPFYEDLSSYLSDLNINDKEDVLKILKNLLENQGLNYGNLPKALLKFHAYHNESRTAMEEHFEEASRYLADRENRIFLHFTVSPEHRKLFDEMADVLCEKYLRNKKISFQLGFSEQKASTDTLAVSEDNLPFRKENGELLFRPGGHGALLENLNDLNEEIVFIGNIDNIGPDRIKAERIKYKKLLGGILIEKASIIHSILDRLEKGIHADPMGIEILKIIRELSPESADKLAKTGRDDFFLDAFNFLNRPIRICGMVRNSGEPGGGPFWIRNKNGEVSKQIIESSQINLDDIEQERIFQSSTHFNPVDMACYIRDFKGNKFNLADFRDDDMGFISRKSLGDRKLKALELPGLWNGSMAGWLTWFVDVPEQTFTPVKMVFDLVRESHRV